MAGVRIIRDNRALIQGQIRAAIEETLRDASDIVEAQAKAVVPVRTGALQDSIHAAPTGVLRYSVSSDKEYAGFVEMGTSHQSAQPFLMPAGLFVLSILPSIARRNLAANVR